MSSASLDLKLGSLSHRRNQKKKEGQISVEDKATLYGRLVDELMKDAPDKKIVGSLMKTLGLSPSADLISQMGTVIQALNSEFSARSQ